MSSIWGLPPQVQRGVSDTGHPHQVMQTLVTPPCHTNLASQAETQVSSPSCVKTQSGRRLRDPEIISRSCDLEEQLRVSKCRFLGYFSFNSLNSDDIIKRNRKGQADAKTRADRWRQPFKNRNPSYSNGRPRFWSRAPRNLQGLWRKAV